MVSSGKGKILCWMEATNFSREPPGKIGAAGAVHEKGVAGKKVAWSIKADGAGAVAGGMDNGQFNLSKGETIAVPDLEVNVRERRKTFGLGGLLHCRSRKKLPVKFMNYRWEPRFFATNSHCRQYDRRGRGC